MTNPITKAYEKFDDGLMYLANKGVRAWNWTTGRTKADLANAMLSVAPVLESVGFANYYKMTGLPVIPFLLGISHVCKKINLEIEDREVKALESGLKDTRAEFLKRASKMASPCYFGLAYLLAIAPNTKGVFLDSTHETNLITAAGFTVSAASHYVIRADYLPPRKNILSRAKDKLVEIIESYQPAPLPAPALARAQIE